MSHASVTATTTKRYMKGAWENFLQDNPIFDYLKQNGQIQTGCHGTSIDWVVRVGRHTPQNIAAFEDRSDQIAQKTFDLRANLGWGALQVGEAIAKRSLAENKGKEALQRLVKRVVPHMASSMTDEGIGSDFFTDDGTGTDALGGLPAILGTGYTADAADKSNKDSAQTDLDLTGTYANHSVARSGLTGVDGAQYDSWVPLVVNSAATGWENDDSGDNFAKAEALEILDHALSLSSFGKGNAKQIDVMFAPTAKFEVIKAAIHEKERIIVQPTQTGSKFGLGSNRRCVVHSDVPIIREQNLDETAAQVGNSDAPIWGLNADEIYLDVLDVEDVMSGDRLPGGVGASSDNMFDIEVSYLPQRNGVFINLEFVGQFKINPRYQFVIADFAS